MNEKPLCSQCGLRVDDHKSGPQLKADKESTVCMVHVPGEKTEDPFAWMYD